MQKILVTVAEAACLLNYSTATIYKLINSCKLPYIKKGKNYLIPFKHLEALVEHSLHYKKP